MTTTYEDWLIGRGMALGTVKQRVKFYDSRLRAWGSFDVSARTIVEWLQTYSGWSRGTYYNHLSSVFAWLEDTGQIEHASNPMRNVKRPAMPRCRPRPLSEDELQRALTGATSQVRHYLLLGCLAGLRAHEVAKFHGRDINADRIRVVGKGGLAANIPTHPVLWSLAQEYPRDGYWFPSRQAAHVDAQTVTQSVRRLFESLGIEGAAHRARHTFGTQLLRGGANLRVVQELMRHSSLDTTAGYLGVDEDELTSAVSALVVA